MVKTTKRKEIQFQSNVFFKEMTKNVISKDDCYLSRKQSDLYRNKMKIKIAIKVTYILRST